MIPHYDAAKRRRQSRDEQSMVTPRDRTWDSARSIAAEAVSHQPLASKETLGRIIRALPFPEERANDSGSVTVIHTSRSILARSRFFSRSCGRHRMQSDGGFGENRPTAVAHHRQHSKSS